MTDVHGLAREALDADGQLYTRGRRAVMETLARIGVPATIPAILDAEPMLKQSSLYRNLAVLQEAGLVTRVDVGDDRAFFELSERVTDDHHHHLVCRECRTVVDVALPHSAEQTLDRAFHTVAEAAGYELTEHRVDLVGVCADCRP
ncbi:MAG TPA: Fur family transcriptional regulator [Ilumatobacter sp.]|nr:Fur family transcriptional regulator [Ilumatobacter sp.]